MNVLLAGLQLVLVGVFAGAGSTKLAGPPKIIANFRSWGYPQWFRIVTGMVELIGAVGMLIGLWWPIASVLAGLLLGATMIGAVLTHYRVKSAPRTLLLPAGLLLLALAVIALQVVVVGALPA